jgi:hypothetical protein
MLTLAPDIIALSTSLSSSVGRMAMAGPRAVKLMLPSVPPVVSTSGEKAP